MVKQEMRNSLDMSISITRNTAVDRVLERQCYQCNSMQAPYVYHCPTCKRCVVYMDHHCPWINNCVGYFNQKAFILFTGYGVITQFYASVLLTTLYTAQLYGPAQAPQIGAATSAAAFALCLTWLSFLFMLTVFADQIVIVINRLSVIERVRLDANRLKGGAVKKRAMHNFKVAFGEESLSLKWLLPIVNKR